MEEGRKEWVDFEMRLHTFLWKALSTILSNTIRAVHRARINWLEFTDNLLLL